MAIASSMARLLPAPDSADLAQRLRAIVGERRVLVRAGELRAYESDGLPGYQHRPSVAVFPGTLLHGVLPGRSGRWPRVTMLVNWWRSIPRMECAPRLDGTPASKRWRVDVGRARTPSAALETIDPSRLLARAAWRDLISKQSSYR